MHRLYSNEDISVFWNSDKCGHARKCVTGCPQAFDFTKKPWIDLSREETAKVWKAVKQCPSGALDVVYNHDVKIELREAEHRSVALNEGEIIGECDYEVVDNIIKIYHTEVIPQHSGKGIARRLVYAVAEAAERKGMDISPICSYAAKVLK